MTVPFENDTGNIVRKLARKSLKSEKRRNLMVVIAVALASCLICFSIVMALSTRQIEKIMWRIPMRRSIPGLPKKMCPP